MKNFTFSCTYDKENHLLRSAWSGHVSDIPKAKAACLEVVYKIKEYQVNKVLNDNRTQVGMWPDVREWLLEEWIPALNEAGLEYFAHVMSPDESTNVEAMKVFNQIHDGIEFVTFTSFNSALNWLVNN